MRITTRLRVAAAKWPTVQRQRHGEMRGPAKPKSRCYRLPRESGDACPLSHAPRNASDNDNVIRPLVPLVVLVCNIATIRATIIPCIIHAIYRHVGRYLSHVRNELSEREPLLTYPDAAPTISHVTRMRWTGAPSDHPFPYAVRARPAAAMRSEPHRSKLGPQTPAAFAHAVPELSASNDPMNTAFANNIPHSATARVIQSAINYKPVTERLSTMLMCGG